MSSLEKKKQIYEIKGEMTKDSISRKKEWESINTEYLNVMNKELGRQSGLHFQSGKSK